MTEWKKFLVEIQDKFLCPLSKEVMIDPVLIDSGQTFDRPFIKAWLDSGNERCPVTNQVLSDLSFVPNNVVRYLISEWCEYQGLTLSRPIKKENKESSSILFVYWHNKLLSSDLEDQKKASSKLRFLTTTNSDFLDSYVDKPDLIPLLFSPIYPVDSNSKVDPQVQQDIIAYLSNICTRERNMKVVAECPSTIPALIQALECENVETRKNAIATIFSLSSLESNKEVIGKTGTLRNLIVLLGQNSSLCLRNVARTLLRLCENNDENKKRVVKDDGVVTAFKNIIERNCFEEMLALLASISSVEEGVTEIERFSVFSDYFFRIIRESSSPTDKENGMVMLFNVLLNDGFKWNQGMRKEEDAHETISQIAHNGTLAAKVAAKVILKSLKVAVINLS